MSVSDLFDTETENTSKGIVLLQTIKLYVTNSLYIQQYMHEYNL